MPTLTDIAANVLRVTLDEWLPRLLDFLRWAL